MTKFMDLTDHRYGKLVVMEQGEPKNGKINWKCLCDCGNTSTVHAGNLRSGATKSCGCSQYSGIVNQKTHGLSRTYIYTLHQRVKRQGACESWNGVDGFQTFLADVGERPGPEYTLKQLDLNHKFSKNNFIWKSRKDLYPSRVNAKLIECFGEHLTIEQATKKYGVKRTTFVMRRKAGKSIEEALTEPVRFQKQKS